MTVEGGAVKANRGTGLVLRTADDGERVEVWASGWGYFLYLTTKITLSA